jgi:hypothetical protein
LLRPGLIAAVIRPHWFKGVILARRGDERFAIDRNRACGASFKPIDGARPFRHRNNLVRRHGCMIGVCNAGGVRLRCTFNDRIGGRSRAVAGDF